MSLSLDEFVKQLEDSGILDGETLRELLPPRSAERTTQELARELVRRKKLTRFQAEEAYKGRARRLVLGNYLLLERIGEGGMGQVFKARHRRMDRDVAIKLLAPQLVRQPGAIARFEREVKAAARINHPNIITAFDADHAGGSYFLVMEYVAGTDLSALVNAHGPLSVRRSLDIILQTARGLEAAHAAGIVHRDIKPGNLLVDASGTVKILDMGIARLGGDGIGGDNADLTTTGTVMGTVDFMAPEQALDAKSADARADIYSLGCTLHWLLTGKAIYDGDTMMARLLAHRDKPIPGLAGRSGPVPDGVEQLFRRMVAKAAPDRHPSMSAIIADLERILAEQSDTSPSILLNCAETIDLAPGTIDLTATSPRALAGGRRRLAIFSGNGRRIGWSIVTAGAIAAAILGAVVFLLRSDRGMRTVKIDRPGTKVRKADSKRRGEVSRGGSDVTIPAEPAKQRLTTGNDAFDVLGEESELRSGGAPEASARLALEGSPESDSPKDELADKPRPAGGPGTTQHEGHSADLACRRPGFEQWLESVAALPVDQIVSKVRDKMVECNPVFDPSSLVAEYRDGAVQSVRIAPGRLTDLSPLQAFVGLASLDVEGSGDLRDLSPLSGMRLQRLSAGRTQIEDLSPLADMPLVELKIGSTRVSSLAPLRRTPLTSLSIDGCEIDGLLPLEGLPLTYLSCPRTGISDLTPLRGTRLRHLICGGNPLTDLTPLEGAPIEDLDIEDTKVVDLAPLADAPLQRLNIASSRVSDLTPIAGKQLSRVILTYAPVSDLEALGGCPIEVLAYGATSVADVDVLGHMPLKEVSTTYDERRDGTVLRRIKTLQRINGEPADAFWRNHPRGE